MAEGNKPAMKVGGRGITAVVWEQTGKNDSKYFTVQVQRSYTDDEGEWHNTDSLRVQDIPIAISALQTVFDKLTVKEL